MNWPRSAYSTIEGSSSRTSKIIEAHERAGEEDVLSAAEVLVEARAEREQAGDVAVDLDRALGRQDDPARTWRSVDFPAPLGPMTASDSPRTRPNDTLRSAQNGSALSRAKHLPERVAQGRLLREAERVTHADVHRVDGVRAGGGDRGGGVAMAMRSEDLREGGSESLEDDRPDRRSVHARTDRGQRDPVGRVGGAVGWP